LQLGASSAAAHQIGLSIWLVFANVIDGPAIGVSVIASKLMSQPRPLRSDLFKQLLQFTCKLAAVTGAVSSLAIFAVRPLAPALFTSDAAVKSMLLLVLKQVGIHQSIVHLTILLEGVAVGGKEFGAMFVGTVCSTALSVYLLLHKCRSVESIWLVGVNGLFAGRIVTAAIAIGKMRYTYYAKSKLDRK